MRHSNYRTILKHYAVLGLTDATRGMDQVPSIGKSKPNATTGTCDDNPQPYPQQSGEKPSNSDTSLVALIDAVKKG